MKKKFAILLITTLFITSPLRAEFVFDSVDDYTGEAFFAQPGTSKKIDNNNSGARESKHTTPPLKQLRQYVQNRAERIEAQNYELAPTASDLYSGEIETSQYASQEVKENFEEMKQENQEDIAELEEENQEIISDKKTKKQKRKATKHNKKEKNKKEKKAKETAKVSDSIILDCEKVDYDTEKYLVKARGNVSVKFVKQNTTVKADYITFDRVNNTIKAEGNVKIIKSGKVITGDYILVDMNEENALIENPTTTTGSIVMRAEKGVVYGDKIVQENGVLNVKDSLPIDFRTGKRGPQMRRMLLPEKNTLTDDMNSGIIDIETKEIIITQKGDLETIEFKRPRVYKSDKLIFKTPSAKFYTNKNHDYVETSHWEIGAVRGLGMYAGPGFVAELPKGSVLKIMPIVSYKDELGYGVATRFSSGTNYTTAAYSSAGEKLLVYGKQDLDDKLYLHYAVNNYMPEWFMGKRRPKYGAALVYENSYDSPSFIIKNQPSSFMHRIEAGHFHDLDFDSNFNKLRNRNTETSRFRYMAQIYQNFYKYTDAEKQQALQIGSVAQLSTSIYGTGDTQVVGRIGPSLHTQYKRWMQDLIYFFAVKDDNSPFRSFDRYRYGQQSLYIRESFRITRWLTLSWFGTATLSDDAPNKKTLQENCFYVSVGPDDLKFNVGYDIERATLRCTVDVMMDAKGTNVEYKKLEIKQDKKAQNSKKKEEPKTAKKNNKNIAPTQQPVLQRAVVENVKVHENVL